MSYSYIKLVNKLADIHIRKHEYGKNVLTYCIYMSLRNIDLLPALSGKLMEQISIDTWKDRNDIKDIDTKLRALEYTYGELFFDLENITFIVKHAYKHIALDSYMGLDPVITKDFPESIIEKWITNILPDIEHENLLMKGA